MPCFMSVLQSPIQAFLRPAVWIPGLNRLHSHREQWVAMSGTADQLVDELVLAVDRAAEADPKTTYAIRKVDRENHKVQIFNWTWAEWLDVVEIEFRDGANGCVEAKCFSFSSGFLPTWFPLCFVLNVILFWVPFYDNKFNSTRLERIRVSMATECRLVPKKNKEPDETTPIVSSSPPLRPASPSSTKDTPTDAKQGVMATEHSQEIATPTNVDSTPVAISTEVEPSVIVSDPVSSNGVQKEAAMDETTVGLGGTSNDESSRRSPTFPSTEPVNA